MRVSCIVERCAAVVVVVSFGMMTASNAGFGIRDTTVRVVDDSTAAGMLGGAAPCPASGGLNCADSSHACSTSGCTATSTVCSSSGALCIALGQLSGQSTFPCSTPFTGGNCRAYTTQQCVLEKFGSASSFYPCSWYDYCTQSSYCGEQLFMQKSS